MDFYTRYKRPIHKGLDFPKPSLTQQHFKNDCDIGKLLARYLGGDISVINRRVKFGDFTAAPDDFHQAMNITAAGRTAWENLPDSVRRTYGNVERFLDALNSEYQRVEDSKKSKTSAKKSETPETVTPKGAASSNEAVHTETNT